MIKYFLTKICIFWGVSWWSRVRTFTAMVLIQSLVRELRSHKPESTVKRSVFFRYNAISYIVDHSILCIFTVYYTAYYIVNYIYSYIQWHTKIQLTYFITIFSLLWCSRTKLPINIITKIY